ncbi:MAG TPA: glutamate 5-kinase, partial [Alphaproteobacteria bacterium]|nr:glutamate 5-kinase [Alphaproteobacteria bacterium]
AEDIAAARTGGQQVTIVSSGAIALGRSDLRLQADALRLEESQAAAAGQVRLAHAYQEVLGAHGVTVAQVLLTLDDTEERRRYLNARSTINTLLKLGAVPVINENDTVATTEIRFGDNDRLSARVAQMVSADCLILLSDVDGLFESDPAASTDATFVAEVTEITSEIEAMAGKARTGTGGMVTKIMAARVALGAGCHVTIARGDIDRPLKAIADGARCTWFVPQATPRSARKQWIAGALAPAGHLTVDAGAVAALKSGKSLLPAGVTGVGGTFERGDAVAIRTASGDEFGRGLSAYSADDARLIMGHKSRETEALLGYRGRDEMIHRDDMVLF